MSTFFVLKTLYNKFLEIITDISYWGVCKYAILYFKNEECLRF